MTFSKVLEFHIFCQILKNYTKKYQNGNESSRCYFDGFLIKIINYSKVKHQKIPGNPIDQSLSNKTYSKGQSYFHHNHGNVIVVLRNNFDPHDPIEDHDAHEEDDEVFDYHVKNGLLAQGFVV